MDEKNSVNELNLYFHIPFCKYKCGFCNLYTVVSVDQNFYDRYTDALCQQLLHHKKIVQKRQLRTVYIGGGTPYLIGRANFKKIFDTISEIYPNWRTTVEEVCMEASPDSVVADPGSVEYLMKLGLTRLNVGIQSLMPDEIREAGRVHATEQMVREAIRIIKEVGLPNLSTDLIMGFHGQTDETWKKSVQELIKLSPETISTYFLTIRPDAWFSKTDRYTYGRDRVLYERYDYARKKLFEAGYVQDSNVRFKKQGQGGYRQKTLQFNGVPYLGIGAGARTYTNTVDYLIGGSSKPNQNQISEYIEMCNKGNYQIKEGFVYDDEERIRKRLALNLFDIDLLDLEKYSYSTYYSKIFGPILNACLNMGLLIKIGETRYQLTREGFKYRDIISWEFFSEKVKEKDKTFYLHLNMQKELQLQKQKQRFKKIQSGESYV